MSISTVTTIGLEDEKYSVLEVLEKVAIPIVRSGDLSQKSTVNLVTTENSAKNLEDFTPRTPDSKSTVFFEPGWYFIVTLHFPCENTSYLV